MIGVSVSWKSDKQMRRIEQMKTDDAMMGFDESEILTACALRFNGYKFIERTEFDYEAALERFFVNGEWNLSQAEELAIFFMLQRRLLKWDLVFMPQNGKHWRAFRTLFLKTYEYEIPKQFMIAEMCVKWDKEFVPQLKKYVEMIKDIHKATVYVDEAEPVSVEFVSES